MINLNALASTRVKMQPVSVILSSNINGSGEYLSEVRDTFAKEAVYF